MFDWDDEGLFFDSVFAPLKATYGGSSNYSAIQFRSETEKDTVDAGEKTDVDFKLMLRCSEWTSPPSAGSTITYNSVSYRILKVETDSNAKTYILTLGRPYA